MTDDLHNMNDLMAELEGISIKTSQGSFVKMEDARRLIEKRKAANAITEQEKPKPRTLVQAREGAKEFLAKQTELPPAPPNVGKSIPASDTAQPSSRT